MENNDSNIKSQQTGGLKLMTVFIAVLGLHVLVIGGFTVYHLMSGGSTDTDLTTADKTHKDAKSADGTAVIDGTTVVDGSMPDIGQAAKSAPAAPSPTPSTDVASTAKTAPAPAPDVTTPSDATALTPGPTPALSTTAPLAPALTTQPLSPAPSTTLAASGTSAPFAPELAPPAEPPVMTSEPAISSSTPSGPVHMPPAMSAPEPAGHQVYTVKITDSYLKIAHAHHITVAQLKEANHIKGNVLHTGQKLIIPSAKTYVAATATTTALDSTWTTPMLADSTPASTASLSSGSSTMTATTLTHHLYTVVKGDTLAKIAHKFKTTAAAIMTENNITDPTKLSIGKKLKIPSRESRSAGNSVPSSTQPSQVQTKPSAPSGELANFTP